MKGIYKTKKLVSPSTFLMLISFLSLAGVVNILNPNGLAYAYTISISYSGAKNIDISPGISGAGASISKDDISVSTTCPSGYNMSISTSVNDNNLYLNGNSSNNQSNSFFLQQTGLLRLARAQINGAII